MHAHKLRYCNSPSRQHRHRRRRNLVNSSTLILHEAARRTRNGLPAAAWMFVAAKYHADLTALREKLEETFWQSNYSDEVSLLPFFISLRTSPQYEKNVYFGRRGPSPSGTVWRANSRARTVVISLSSPRKNVRSVLAQGTRRVRNSPLLHVLSPSRQIVVN